MSADDRPVSAPGRLQAQQRADAIATFAQELARLEAAGVLTLNPAQRAAVDAHHQAVMAGLARDWDVDRDLRARQLSLGMRVASLLGALALAASVYFLFRQFWGGFATTAQVATLAAASVGTFAFALWLKGRDPSGYFTNLAALAALTCFAVNLTMLGQIFNIAPSDHVLAAWALFALLLAYGCELRLPLGIGIACAMAYIATRTGALNGLLPADVVERPENFLPAALLFLVPQLVSHERRAGFAALYRALAALALFLPLLALGVSGHFSYLDFAAGAVERVYQLLGFACAAGAVWLGLRRQWPEVANLGVFFFVVYLYIRCVDWWWNAMPRYLFFLLLALMSVLVIVVLRRLRGHGWPQFAGRQP